MISTFEDFLANSTSEIPLVWFVIDLVLTAALAFFLKYTYEHYGDSLSNRKFFSRIFILISISTMVIITIVKSSLALSLGLVGALSIIRFRAAIKEPEELSYLFLVIAIGLGFGANQRLITIVAFIFIVSLIIFLKKASQDSNINQNLYLTIHSNNSNNINLEKIVSVLKENSSIVKLNRIEETQDTIEASFWLEIIDFNQLNKTKMNLRNLDSNIKISFIDDKGIY